MPMETAAAISLYLGFEDDNQRQTFLAAMETLIENTTNNIFKANRSEFDQVIFKDDTGSGLDDKHEPIKATIKEIHYNPKTKQWVVVQGPPEEVPPEGE